SSNPAVASITPAGQLVGIAVGGPVTITATVEGKSGTASVSVADDNRIGYALADQASVAGPYAPNANYRFDSSGGAIQVTESTTGVLTDVHITRDSAGSYKAYLGVPRVAGSGHETVVVTAVGTGPERCATNWDEIAGFALAQCNMGFNNIFVDTRFSVLWVE